MEGTNQVSLSVLENTDEAVCYSDSVNSAHGYSDDEIGWHYESNFANRRSGRRRIKKIRKLCTPCRCKQSKSGKKCKHSKGDGFFTGATFDCSRSNQVSSDSEEMIRRSMRRIRSVPNPPTMDRPSNWSPSLDSPSMDLDRLVNVGHAIGLNLEDNRHLVKSLIDNGDGLETW